MADINEPIINPENSGEPDATPQTPGPPGAPTGPSIGQQVASRSFQTAAKQITNNIGRYIGAAVGGPAGAAVGYLTTKFGPKIAKIILIFLLLAATAIIIAFFGLRGGSGGTALEQISTTQDKTLLLRAGILTGSDSAKEQFIETNSGGILTFINSALTAAKAKQPIDQGLIDLLAKIQANTQIVAQKGAGVGSLKEKQDKIAEIKSDFAELAKRYPGIFTVASNQIAEQIASLSIQAAELAKKGQCPAKLKDCKAFVTSVVKTATGGKTDFAKSANANGLYDDLKNNKYPGWKFIDLDAEKPQRGDVMLCHRNKPGSSGEIHGHTAIYIGEDNTGKGKTIAASYNKDPKKAKPPHLTGNGPGLGCEKSSKFSGYQGAARYIGS